MVIQPPLAAKPTMALNTRMEMASGATACAIPAIAFSKKDNRKLTFLPNLSATKPKVKLPTRKPTLRMDWYMSTNHPSEHARLNSVAKDFLPSY